MEQNDDDFQPSKPKSYRNTRNKLSNKHRLKLQCNEFGSSKERCGVEDLYSPLSFKRKTSIFEENTLETIPSGEQDGIESNNGDSFELSKETETIDNEQKLVQECRNESVNVIEHESDNTKAGSDDSFDRIRDQSEFLGKLNSSKTDNISECISEVHCYLNQGISISCNDDTRRHVICPLCWKTFEKKEAQMLHMKTCAARYNVTTRQLLDAVELQERQAAERQALGLPDIPTVHAIKKSSSRKNGGSDSDGNLQLALALSASMQEAEEFEQLQQDDCLLEAGLGHEVVEKQKVMLERFGFTSSRPAVLVPSNPKSRPGNKRKNSNAILLNRTKEERERLVTEKVAIILMGDEDKPSATINTPQSIPPADDLGDTTKNLQKYQNKKELKRYGLKPSLTKKQAKTMLRYIYDQMHPYITISDTEDSTENSEMERSPSFKKPGSDTQIPRSPVKTASISGTSGSPVRRNILRTEVVSRRSPVTRRRDISSQSDADYDDLLLSQERSSSSATSVTE